MNNEIISSNSSKLLYEIMAVENPTKYLCELFDKSSPKEIVELRALLRELKEKGFVKFKWADNRPYIVTITNTARLYVEQYKEYDNCHDKPKAGSVIIGSNNRIYNSTIASEINGTIKTNKRTFFERHPVICSFLISLFAGIVLLFSFWQRIIELLERLF